MTCRSEQDPMANSSSSKASDGFRICLIVCIILSSNVFGQRTIVSNISAIEYWRKSHADLIYKSVTYLSKNNNMAPQQTQVKQLCLW